MQLSSGLHLVAACDAHNRQLVSRRRILKYSMYTMIQALELRANRRARGCAGHWSGTPGVSDFAKYRAPRTHRERHARPHERASKTVQPTSPPPRSGKYPRRWRTYALGRPIELQRPEGRAEGGRKVRHKRSVQDSRLREPNFGYHVNASGRSTSRPFAHVPRAYPRREPDSRSMHGEHSRTSLRRHARTSIITVLYTRTTVASYSLHLSHTILSS